MKKIKLAIDVRSYKAGGIGRYLQQILPALIVSDEFQVVLVGPQKYKNYPEFEKSARYIVHNMRPFSFLDLFYFPSVDGADFLWFPNIHIPWIRWFFSRGSARKIITIHDVNPLAFKKDNYSFFKRNILRLYYFFSIHHAWKLITVSEFSRIEILRFFSSAQKKITVISNGFSPWTSFKKDGELHNETFHSDFLFVSSYRKHKNIERVIRAFLMFVEEFPDTKVKIAGFEWSELPFQLQDELKRYEEQIQLFGFVSEETLDALYRNAETVVVPSLYEGFGYPVLEAVFYRKNVVCSDIPPFHEIMGENALYFNPMNIENIRSNLKKGVAQKEDPAKLQYDQIIRKYSKKQMLDEYVNFFLKL